MVSNLLKILVNESWISEGTSPKGKKWQRVDLVGVVEEGGCLVTDFPVSFSHFVKTSEQATSYRKGDVVTVDLDNLKFDKRKIFVTGQLVP